MVWVCRTDAQIKEYEENINDAEVNGRKIGVA